MTNIAITSYNGAGKTAVALAVARTYRAETNKNTLVTEAVGAGNELTLAGLASRCGLREGDHRPLSVLATEGGEPARWHGVDVIAMDWFYCQDQTREFVADFWARTVEGYDLAVFDVRWPHPFAEPALELADAVVVLGGPLDDAADNALRFAEYLKVTHDNVVVAFNQMGRLEDRVVLAGLERDLDLPYLRDPDAEYTKLGRPILDRVVPDWAGEKRGWLARLLGRGS